MHLAYGRDTEAQVGAMVEMSRPAGFPLLESGSKTENSKLETQEKATTSTDPGT